jgi:dihydroorotate dehydrogenase electron transfer subunit
MTKRIESLRIVENKKLNKDFFLLKLTPPGRLPEMKPGQFVQVKVEGSPETFLRRPFSIHDVSYSENTFRLLIQIAGKGTETLSRLSTGDSLNVVYPLGNSFSLPEKNENILLAGGGCGIAPLLFLGKFLNEKNYTPDILLGFRSSERVMEYDEYAALGRIFLTTEDGSMGKKGFITDHPVLNTNSYDVIYCCGPESMMKAMAAYCRTNSVKCEVSLENLMACGIGVCLCCTVETIRGNLCTCTEGPVFNINDLIW